MKFKTRIAMLPLSATAIFCIGLAISFTIGAGTSTAIRQLSEVDYPYLDAMNRAENAADEARRLFESAAAEGEVGKLGEIEPIARRGREAAAAIAALEGRQQKGAALGAAFDDYVGAAGAAVRAMLDTTSGRDSSAAITLMQSKQKRLDGELAASKQEARETLQRDLTASADGVRTGLIANGVTAALIIAALGAASWLLVASVWRQIGGELEEVGGIVGRIAEGDLSMDIRVEPDDRGSLLANVARMAGGLRTMVGDIRRATDSIDHSSREIADGSISLSARTESQAASIEQTSAAIKELGDTVRQNAQNARNAYSLAAQADQHAQQGGVVVGDAVATMQSISESSKQISEIVSVIDGIAFQTNILALNAAVEAARAGEQGRGFAVVASEVRALAKRSADASKEIGALIGSSVDRIQNGVRLVDAAGNAMSDIVRSVREVSGLVGGIAEASAEQSLGLDSAAQAVAHIDQSTQQNAVLVDQSTHAAQNLRANAGTLGEVVGRFQV